MHNPPHPGEFIREVYLEPNGITGRQLAAKLGVSPSTLNRVLQGTSGISPEMALRLSKALGRSPVFVPTNFRGYLPRTYSEAMAAVWTWSGHDTPRYA
jgi:addiction module HigA family antidote